MGDQGRGFGSGRGVSEDSPGADSPLPDADSGQKNGEVSTLLLLGRLTGFGWYVAISIAGGALLGAWLDNRLGTSPGLLLAGLAVGIAVAALGLVRLVRTFGGWDAARNDPRPVRQAKSARPGRAAK